LLARLQDLEPGLTIDLDRYRDSERVAALAEAIGALFVLPAGQRAIRRRNLIKDPPHRFAAAALLIHQEHPELARLQPRLLEGLGIEVARPWRTWADALPKTAAASTYVQPGTSFGGGGWHWLWIVFVVLGLIRLATQPGCNDSRTFAPPPGQFQPAPGFQPQWRDFPKVDAPAPAPFPAKDKGIDAKEVERLFKTQLEKRKAAEKHGP
jgi:hypothetical protein